MKVIILLGGFGTRMRPHTWSRAKALVKVSGNTVLGHLLDQMSDITTEEVIYVVGYKGDQIREWVETNYGHLNNKFAVQEQALGQAHAVYMAKALCETDGEVVVAFGDGVVRAEFGQFPAVAGHAADAVLTYLNIEDPRSFGVMLTDEAGRVEGFIEKPDTVEHKKCAVGINWFRSSDQLFKDIEQVMREDRQTKGEFYLADVYNLMLERQVQMLTMPVEFWLDAGQPHNAIETNCRLLGLGYGTDDAIDRGYGEGFTVIPPVYIAESAEIEASVIGPYAHIDEGCVIKNSVISNSIIDPHAQVSNAVLDQALVGEKAQVSGHAAQLFVGDNSKLKL